jgi:hypothetical protein
MTGNELRLSYSALVKKVVYETTAPLSVAEIVGRVNEIRPIETRSPENTIRAAINGCYLIVNTGAGGYAWYPRMLKGSRMRTPLIDADLEQRRIIFDDDVRELIWPSFFANQELADRRPVKLRLLTGGTATLSLDFFGSGVWGAHVTRELWRWLSACEAKEGDSVIIEAIDAEQRSYRISLDAGSVRNEQAIRQRTEEIEEAAREYLWKRRALGSAVWDLTKHLLVTGKYRHATPPDPITPIWNRVCGQVSLVESLSADRRSRRKSNSKSGQKLGQKLGQKSGMAKQARIYQLKITLPIPGHPVWRRLLVREDANLGELHRIIQLVIGWTNSHLHLFQIGDRYYSDPVFGLNEDQDEDEYHNENRATLGKVLKAENEEMIYQYDFGDSWRHVVALELILPEIEGDIYPRCIDGEASAPPEDCGGVAGYADFLKAIRDENHPEHESMLKWVGGAFDPDRCDLKSINWQLERSSELSAV